MPAQCEPAQKPHIIFVLGDDIGYNDVPWNNPKMAMPHLNSLASQGIILSHHYSLPFCTPSRAALLSGLQRLVLSSIEPYGIPTKYQLLPARLKEANYSTHAIGKWHLGYCSGDYTPLKRGFDSFLGFYTGGEENYRHCQRNDVYYGDNCTYFDFRDNWRKGFKYQGQYTSEIYSKKAVSIIDYHNTESPLFLYLSPNANHFPVQSPDYYCEKCQTEKNQARRQYCCALQSIDSLIHNVTLALKSKQMMNNSVIIFVSDNGGTNQFGGNNFPLRGQKGSLWEGGTRVPAFVFSPLLMNKGTVNNNLIHITDWYPTILGLAGIQPSEEIDGIDQWSTISENKQTMRKDMLYNMDIFNGTMFAAVRDNKYKLIVAPPGNPKLDSIMPESEVADQSFNTTYLEEFTSKTPYVPPPDSVVHQLFNLEDDPFEEHNLLNFNDTFIATIHQRLNDTLHYHLELSKPAVKFPNDPRGNPKLDGNWYFTGWCKPFYDVPNVQ